MNALVAGYVLNELGFQFAPKSDISQLLKKIRPTGGTAFRDSLIGGCNLLIKLYQILQKTGASDHWNFVHVILTDGADQDSNTNLENTLKTLFVIGQLLNVKMLKIILIGVGVSQKAELQLRTIAKAGGQNAEYYSIDNAEIDKIFQRITVNLGLQERQQVIGVSNKTMTAFMVQKKVQPVISLKVQHYAVLLNLDVSGSMAGQKWKSVCESVNKFIDFLGEEDLIAAMVFNDQSKMLSKMSNDDKLFGETQTAQKKIAISIQGKQVEVNPEECQIY